MDVFGVHDQLISDYRAFTSGAVNVRDEEIASRVRQGLDDGDQWPDPWLSLNPNFADGGSVPELVDAGVLHPESKRIFQVGKSEDSFDGTPMRLYRHQRDAIEAARTGDSYVLITGTGSGKSLAYIIPIVDRVLRERDQGIKGGVKAIIVYPMNALANSQMEELSKFLTHGYGKGAEPVTFARYTGQESESERRAILDAPPDILLTNYVMLELMLTRPRERKGLIRAAQGLRFLVLDELHTYRGRQGADVAMLVRRVRDACQAPGLQCVGTSATMATEGTSEDQQRVVAEVASKIFGTTVHPHRVIGETLTRATAGGELDPDALAAKVREPTREASYEELVNDPLARWIESTFGLDTEEGTGRLVRRRPTTIRRAAAELAALTKLEPEACAEAIKTTLRAGTKAAHPTIQGRSLFAFRLHQFLSKGDTVYVSLEPKSTRHITREYQLWVPGEPHKLLLPLAFCRQCGQEYLIVAYDEQGGRPVIRHRREDDEHAGYLYISEQAPWPETLAQALAEQRLPDSWLTYDSGGNPEVIPSRRKYVPQTMYVLPDGTIGDRERGVRAAFVPTPFGFCLACGVSYEQMRGDDFGKLARLDQEGRSSAITVVSGSVVRSLEQMPDHELAANARKLLTFVDNRQDASLQAGHFNDFAQVVQLRGALYHAAVQAGEEGLQDESLAKEVLAQLGLDHADYAANPEELSSQRRRTQRAMREVITYRLFVDLERGWRVTMPNLEQTGLIRIDYADLDELAARDALWKDTYGPLATADAATRAELMRVLLDEMRRVLAIDAEVLTDVGFEEMRTLSRQLREPWALPDRERLVPVGTVFPRSGKAGGSRSELNLSGRSRYGRYLRRPGRFPHWGARIDTEDAQRIITDLFKVMARHGLVTEAVKAKDGNPPGYRINSSVIIWRAGDGRYGAPDPLRWQFNDTDAHPRVDPFFRELYRSKSRNFAGLVAREHTAQVPSEVRREREHRFRNADLKLLYCSPTMELGVDIAGLNAVAMRNVPPTPANYAQRSGRAGRSGQAALVVTYCSSGNSHDRYYFRRSAEMVAGSVVPPRLDLGNEDLIRAHVQAIWLAETEVPLGRAMPDLIDIADEKNLPLLQHVADQIRDPQAQQRALRRAENMLAGLLDVLAKETTWWDEEWLPRVVRSAPERFDAAFDRWRDLYRKAKSEREIQHRRADDYTLTQEARRRASRRRAEAETQLRLLRNEQDRGEMLSDFNPYRYLASEGFLPGYSFPRLPIAAYIPGRGGARYDESGDYLQRSRFIAIREFGPGALIYHEGSRYQVKRVQVPTDGGGNVATGEARRCRNCGYHHEPRPGLDLCEMCREPLPIATGGWMQLHTVFTERRERISSDEEERRRAGFELQTSYRFTDHGKRKGRLDAEAVDDQGLIAELVYGDSATVRVANLGYRRRGKDQGLGFMLDTVNGRWLPARDTKHIQPGTELTDEETGLAEGDYEDVVSRMRVIPYVEDRRNILVFTLAKPVSQEAALSLQYALERGIEAVFQLEDSELDSEPLPPDHGPERLRMLFVESAEGGAGVLRRLQAEPDALARVARRALQIAHFDPDTGADLGSSRPGERCERGCYDCLLSFGNQRVHHLIDRHAARDLLLRLARGTVRRDEKPGELTAKADSALEGELIDWLAARGYRLPTEQQVLVTEALAQPDYVYRLPGAQVAVFVDGPHHDDAHVSARDSEAEERLLDAGWHVIRFPHDGDWERIVRENRSVFGPGEQTGQDEGRPGS
ncbi:DEAD/DEAH box helicase [uncultured Thermomonospora sp.]|uniref:DEAD/DEAH box helicase n=1 Tax=uncultured Thermomonospora sp. TaxID=671175 RepID=UPI00259B9D0A|nr:DEAD/DEAH box helicase [uncultured Thermomonospora sp.]